MRTITVMALALALALALSGCGGGEEPAAAPSSTVDRYAIYADLVEQEAQLAEGPEINAREADDLAQRVCASSTDNFRANLDARRDGFNALNEAILDRRMFVIAYCDERLPDFDRAATAACADAVEIVGRNCPGKFSTGSQ
jgi:hypothetical protein